MLVRWVGFLLVAMAVSVTSYVVIWPRVLHATSNPQMSPAAKNYLDQAIKLFRAQHIDSAKVDWPALTKDAYWAADGAKTTADTYSAIWLIIRSLGEKHTFLVEPDQARADATGQPIGDAKPQPFLSPEGERLTNGIGVIRLFRFLGTVNEGNLYAEKAQAEISDMKAHGVCRFVLDLRQDEGGNMYPMLSGVSGILEPGILGTFQFPNGQYAAWALADGTVIEQRPQKPLPVATPTSATLPVAVLIGPHTGSAGEFTAMSFEGRANTRFFGSPTAGYVTANTPIQLSDGAVLVMTGAWGLDRTGRRYLDRIEPDEGTGPGDAALPAAVTWLSQRPCNSSQRRQGEGAVSK